MTRIIVLARAEWDLEDRHLYFENEEPGLGDKFLRALEEGIARIRQFPYRYAKYWKNIRICPLAPFKIGAFYRIEDEVVYVMRVLDLRRSRRGLRRELGP